MIFNVFQRDVERRSLETKRGFKPYKKRAGLFGSKSYLVDEVSDKLARFETNLGLLTRKQQAQALEMIDNERSKFTEAGLIDMRSEFAIANMQNVMQQRTEAAKDLSNVTFSDKAPSSTAEAQRQYNRRIQGFRRAKSKLRQAAAQAGETGVSVQYQGTGYEMLDPSVDRFYDMFDEAVAARKDEYAQLYSNMSYDEISYSGYSGMDDMRDEIGTKDIDALVLGDILNQSLFDLAFLDTAGYEEIGTDQTMEMLRENFATVYSKGIESINTIAQEEDEGRARMAKAMEAEARKTQAQSKVQTERSIGQQISNISKAERSAKKRRDAQMSALTDTPTSKRRVKGVDFTEDRPQ